MKNATSNTQTHINSSQLELFGERKFSMDFFFTFFSLFITHPAIITCIFSRHPCCTLCSRLNYCGKITSTAYGWIALFWLKVVIFKGNKFPQTFLPSRYFGAMLLSFKNPKFACTFYPNSLKWMESTDKNSWPCTTLNQRGKKLNRSLKMSFRYVNFSTSSK